MIAHGNLNHLILITITEMKILLWYWFILH